MPRVRFPKRGSKAFSPRKRAKNIAGRVDFWPDVEEGPQLLGFAGYKAGMTHVFLIEDLERSPDYSTEVRNSATVIDAPPMLVCAVRAYAKTHEGLKPLTEVWMDNPPADMLRRVKPLTPTSSVKGLDVIASQLEKVDELRVIASTQPRLTSVSKKKPNLMEIKIGGGSGEEQLNYAKELLGKTLRVSDVFKVGESIDIIGVTKGKGFQGPVKRWGIRILQRKSRKTVRGVASIGPWHPARVMPGVPRAGQMGFHHRTEYNKRILLLGSDGERVTPKGGYNRYGVVSGDFLLLKGSVMGPTKRLIKLRKAARKSRYPDEAPQVTHIHAEYLRSMEVR
jgi:large subunit ribosomal protein L3